MPFVRFMESTTGRVVRSVAGVAMVAVGVSLGGYWWALAVVGLLPLAAGLFDVCLAAPLLGAPVHHAVHDA
ncbi:MAG: DUF2892 domain-containing protein [Actinomycetota bacterium]|jgi:predicted esterase YcpF (UPF0227 family)|nr:DUF2892 domain-containing protein [Actinomycetota bacterium]